MAAQTESHASRGSEAVIVAVVSTSIAFFALASRLITKTIVVNNFGSEDLVISVSFALSVALTALVCVEVQNGLGRHYATLNQDELTAMFKAFWASVPIYQASLSLTKVSILLQYQRVFVGPIIRKVIWALLAVTIVYGIWSVCVTAFMCTPISYFWNSTISGHCLNRMAVWFSNASLNILTDIAIFLVPMPVLNKLHLPSRQKFALMAVFGLGAFVCLTSILRLHSLYVISVSKDVTWDNVPALYWSSLEVNLSITAACLPSLRKPISRLFPKFFSAYSANASRRYSRSRNVKNGSGFQKFSARSDWMQGLQTPNQTARECGGVGSEDKIELNTVVVEANHKCSVSSSDDGTTLEDLDHGRIRVMTTITTQEVEHAKLETGAVDRRTSPQPF